MSNLRTRFWNDKGHDWIEISIVGDPATVSRKVTDADKARFDVDWKAYRNASKVEIKGTPLTAILGVGPVLEKRLIASGVRTVEELAEVPDGSLPRVVGMGGFAVRKKAQEVIRNQRKEAIDRTVAA
jgi:predicted flap endonuclease-1-like 5' DNA nuclease